MIISDGLTFDDVLLVPQHSVVGSRSKVDLSVNWRQWDFKHPIIPANMKTVTGLDMSIAIAQSGGLAILHRFMPIEEQIKIAQDMTHRFHCANNFAVSVGVKDDDLEAIDCFRDVGVEIFCIDIAHGDSRQCMDMVQKIKESYPQALIIAGNVATGSAARRLWEAGADVVKVGVGPGSLCTTRIETGNGVPQLTALMDVYQVKQELLKLDKAKSISKTRTNYAFIADGGIKNAGDCVKALCFADMVMAGNLFAGCKESPGKIHTINGQCYKEYVGSSTHKANRVEGVEAWVPCKGNYEELLTKLLEGIQSGCSYQGCQNLQELKENPTFVKITNAGLKESHPHDVILK